MAFDLLLDQITNDLVIENGDFRFTTESSQEVTQRLSIRLNTFQGEWFIDLDYGIPYMQQIISQARNKEDVDVILLSEIRSEDGVNSIKDYFSEWDKSTRQYSFKANINTNSGQIPVAVLSKPSQEWIYPDNGDQNSRVECGVTDLEYSANRLYQFINLTGLPENGYSSWINHWA